MERKGGRFIMKPISVRFKCFGPYRQEMFVDFEELEKKGLFLICGETGAGKTTILDAICYALYGKSSGGLRGDLSVMRCKLADAKEETVVEFTFDADGKRYRFVRTLRYGRKNLIDEHNCMVLKDDEFVPIFENPKQTNVNKKAEEIIGLNYEQFRQVIILPQGKFETLLVSDSAEKEKILVSLFKAEKWQKIADELYERVAEEDKKLKIEIQDIKSRLKDYQCENVEELVGKIVMQETHLEEISKAAKVAEQLEKDQKEVYEKALVVNEQFLELDKRQQMKARLQAKLDAMKVLNQKLKLADEAEVLRPVYEKWQEVKTQVDKLQGQKMNQAERLRQEEENLRKVEEKKKAHEAGKASYEAGIRRCTILENAKAIYASFDAKREDVLNAEKNFKIEQRNLNIAKDALEKNHQNWILRMDDQKVKMQRYTEAQRQYLSGISGTLAASLENGMPCPVCGSLEHPSPAKQEAATVSEKTLDSYNKELQAATKAVEDAAKKRVDADAKYQDIQSKAQTAEQSYLTVRAAYEEMLTHRLEGVETFEQLKTEVDDLKKRIAKYEELSVRLQNSLNDQIAKVQTARDTLQQIENQCKEIEIALEEKRKEWQDKLESSEFQNEQQFEWSLMDPAEKNQKKNELLTFKTQWKAAKEALEEQLAKLDGTEKPDMRTLKMKVEEAASVQKRAEKEYIIGQQNLDKMQKDLQSLSKRKEKHDERRIRIDGDLEFANRLRGRSGVSLQRYVLGVMLSSITTEANRLLKNVHKGRYQLYRTDSISGSGRKGGLELEVLDTQNQERRSVTTLSGGEKFLVALSLAIGLSTVVQAQGKGMRLGAMFIDEGFGSLDENSIYDALEVLQGIQKASGLVGIISHVELLREVIPSKIEVHKSKNGSWFT